MMTWLMVEPGTDPEILGFIPSFLSEDDPRPATEQVDANYGHGGGWRPMQGFKLNRDMSLSYPGDPPYHPLAITRLRKEFIVFYPYSFLLVIKEDNSWEVARVD